MTQLKTKDDNRSKEVNASKPLPYSNGAIISRFVFSCFLVLGIYYLLIGVFMDFSLESFFIGTVILVLYCLISYFLSPAADMTSREMNRPLAFSNHDGGGLVFIMLFFMLGSFIVESIVLFYKLLRA